jgi:hypothetical protein
MYSSHKSLGVEAFLHVLLDTVDRRIDSYLHFVSDLEGTFITMRQTLR